MVYIAGNKENRYGRVYARIYEFSRRTYLQISIIPNVSNNVFLCSGKADDISAPNQPNKEE